MLQQTQTGRVAQKYEEFLRRFPTWQKLAGASLSEVYEVWRGLGYNRRARALRDAAQIVCERWSGALPTSPEDLESLPGVGTYTARAVAAFAFNEPTIVLETNIRAAILHAFFNDERAVADTSIESVLRRTVSHRRAREWYWALMDYGVMVKQKHPDINARSAHYRKQSPFKGSIREARGAILKVVSRGQNVTLENVGHESGIPRARLAKALEGLKRDGLVAMRRKRIVLCR